MRLNEREEVRSAFTDRDPPGSCPCTVGLLEDACN
jgi:hypothetical protein